MHLIYYGISYKRKKIHHEIFWQFFIKYIFFYLYFVFKKKFDKYEIYTINKLKFKIIIKIIAIKDCKAILKSTKLIYKKKNK